jgi:phosphatidylinositol glycan class V
VKTTYQASIHSSKFIIGKMLAHNLFPYFSNMGTRNNGLFRYWTLGNVPLFLLGMPMFSIMAVSGFWALQWKAVARTDATATSKDTSDITLELRRLQVLRNLAVSQLILALYTFVAGHVQIISRISSAYPVWVWYLAMGMVDQKENKVAKHFVSFMVIYAVIQGGLFASFLPPA